MKENNSKLKTLNTGDNISNFINNFNDQTLKMVESIDQIIKDNNGMNKEFNKYRFKSQSRLTSEIESKIDQIESMHLF